MGIKNEVFISEESSREDLLDCINSLIERIEEYEMKENQT